MKQYLSECDCCAVAKVPYLPIKTPMTSIITSRPPKVLAMDLASQWLRTHQKLLPIVLICKSIPNASHGCHHDFRQELTDVPQELTEPQLKEVLVTLQMTLMISSSLSKSLRTPFEFQLQSQKDKPCVVLPCLTRDNMQTPIISPEF